MKKPMKMTKGSKAKMGPASKMPVAKDMGSMMLAKGGKVKYARGGGIESRGKTRGKFI